MSFKNKQLQAQGQIQGFFLFGCAQGQNDDVKTSNGNRNNNRNYNETTAAYIYVVAQASVAECLGLGVDAVDLEALRVVEE
jgi:hypothetical protein